MELGYLGPEGSYSYEAALSYSRDSKLVSMKTFSHIIDGVEKDIIEKGILPMENSTEGAVTSVMDALLNMNEVSIQDEIIIPVTHNLFGTDDKIDEIRFVVSHFQAIRQCHDFFENRYPDINLLSCESSSIACNIAKEKGSQYGVIASKYAGDKYKLKLIASDIQDNLSNETRFVIIGKNRPEPTGYDKTSIVFSFYKDKPGNLFSVLKIFAEAGINLTRIESRPEKKEIGKYKFYIDFVGHAMDSSVNKALNEIKKGTKIFRVLGSYPVHK